MRVGDLGEFRLIARLEKRLQRSLSPRIVRGIGDDCAVVQPSDGMELLLTVDTQEEGVHFKRQWTTPEDIGWRCLAVNVSDIAAMAGRPLGAIVALSLPASLDVAFLEAFYDGMQELAAGYDCPVIGGNISRRATEAMSVSITVLGETPRGRSVYRSGARVGDEIWVTGRLGGARAGLAALGQPTRVSGLATEQAVRRYCRPRPRLYEAQYLRQQANLHSLLDLSDGLSSDLRHICEASGVAAYVEAERVPIDQGVQEIAAACEAEPLDYALHGGEDFELCLTVAPGGLDEVREAFEQRFQCQLVRVGTIREGAGVVLVARDGTREPLPVRGYDHFRAPEDAC
jgi:thiamine-monophosphate kinase